MFRIAFMVDDKFLAQTLKGLGGKVLNLEVQPVVNATKKGGKLAEKGEGSMNEIVEAFLKEQKNDSFLTKDLGRKLEAGGYAYTSVYNVMTGLLKDKRIKKGKGKGENIIIKGVK